MDKHVNVSIAEVKNRLSKIINEVVFVKKRIIINSHGQPKAAMISLDGLQKSEEMKDGFTHLKETRLHSLDKATQLRKVIFVRKMKMVSDSSISCPNWRENCVGVCQEV